MLRLRQRAALAARRIRPAGVQGTRSYASEAHGHGDHGHHAAPAVEESLGAAFYIGLGAIPFSMLLYYIGRSHTDGETPGIKKRLGDYIAGLGRKWEIRNQVQTAAIEQAAHDKHLFLNSGRNRHIELKYPEVFAHGSPYNVPAGHYINLDKVIEHYRQQHLETEEKKAKKLAAKLAEKPANTN